MQLTFSSLVLLLALFCVGTAYVPLFDSNKENLELKRMAPNTQENRLFFGLAPQDEGDFCHGAQQFKSNYLENMTRILKAKDNYFRLMKEINIYPKTDICLERNWEIRAEIIHLLRTTDYYQTKFVPAIIDAECVEKEKMIQGNLDENRSFKLTSSGLQIFDSLICVASATEAPQNYLRFSNQEMQPNHLPSSRFF